MASLDPIADRQGRFAILAMDQRGTLRRMLDRAGKASDGESMTAFKIDVIGALSPLCSGVLTDPDYGLDQVRDAGALAEGTGVLLAAEPATKAKLGEDVLTTLEPGHGAAWVAERGADALKFLVQWDPDRAETDREPDLTRAALGSIGEIVADCARHGVPSVIEPLIAGPASVAGDDQRFAAVIRSAERMAAWGMDLLKLEWPGVAGCEAVSERLGGVPWTLLSAGVGYEDFVERVRTALDGGASGFIAGRAIWGEAVEMDGDERRRWLSDVARPRLERLVGLLDGAGRSWEEARG